MFASYLASKRKIRRIPGSRIRGSLAVHLGKDFVKEEVVEQDKLIPGMRIIAYQGLEARFGTLDAEKVQWLAHNFKGTTAIKVDGSQVAIDALKVGDRLLEIGSFPASLLHLCEVGEGLVKALKSQGFSRFKVQTASAQESHIQSVGKATLLVEKTKKSKETQARAAKEVEKVMDALAQGAASLESLNGLVEEIVENSYLEAIGALATLKQSDYTYGHCVDVGAIFAGVYFEIQRHRGVEPVFADLQEALLSGLLHDLGKSSMPKDILESPLQFEKDSPEMRLQRGHSEKTGKLLTEMKAHPVAINMGLYHHVKPDGDTYSSYPKNLDFKDALFETRLLAIIDSYQALTGRRPFKRSWSAPAAMRYLEALSGVEYDEEAFEGFAKVLGLFPVGSLVELSDKSRGFVMNVPQGDLSRPQVVLIQDPEGRDLNKHPLVDLSVTQGLSIVKDLDPVELFGEKALDRFLALKVG